MRIPSLKSWLIFAAGFATCLVCIVVLIFSAYFFWIKPMEQKVLKRSYVGREDVKIVAVSGIPFERQFQMREGDADQFQLPGGKTVAVWCERPPDMMMLAEQTTASGLKTAWGERPFVRPEPLEKQIGPNSYESAGWKSYILQGAVTTSSRAMTSEYVLYVDDLQFSIIEDLKATNSLPVTIRIIKK